MFNFSNNTAQINNIGQDQTLDSDVLAFTIGFGICLLLIL